MHYFSLGKIPPKRHTQYRQPNGKLYHEQLFSTEGFDNMYSNLYHVNPPTQIVQVNDPFSVAPKLIHDEQLKHRSLLGFNIEPEDDYLKSRKPVLVNNDCKIILSAPKKSMEDYFVTELDRYYRSWMNESLNFSNALFENEQDSNDFHAATS